MICTFLDLFALLAIFWKENPKSVKMIVFEVFFGQCRILPDKNQDVKLIQKVDRFLRGPRRALGRDRVTLIGGQPILFRGIYL